MNPKLGFIGLGEMGKWMALRIAKAGYPLVVYDLRTAPVQELARFGALPAKNPYEVARKANHIFLSLPDEHAVEEVLFAKSGLNEGLSEGSIIIDLSTVDYLATLRFEERLRSRGVTYIDAPVTGMEARAKEGTLTVMVGGEPGAVESIRPFLDALANTVVYMGKSGNGQLTKLINQLFFNISAAALAELLPMASKLGLDPEDLVRVITTGTGRTFALEFFAPNILQNDFGPGYSLSKAYKDMVSAAEISSRRGIPLPVVAAAMQTYQMALAQGLGHENKGAMIKVWEKVLGVEVRSKKLRVQRP